MNFKGALLPIMVFLSSTVQAGEFDKICKKRAQKKGYTEKTKQREFVEKCIERLEAATDDEQLEARPVTSDSEDQGGKKQRDSWYIGFAVFPKSDMKVDGKSPIESADSTVGIDFEVGWTISDQLLAGFDIASFSESTGSAGARLSAAITRLGGSASFFPVRHPVYIKGGLYFSTVSIEAEFLGQELRASRSGHGAGLGTGYAFWLGDSFNLLIEVDYSYHKFVADGSDDFASLEFEKGQVLALGLGFYWY
jgi:hypothetical protein